MKINQKINLQPLVRRVAPWLLMVCAGTALATPDALNWDTLTWVPQGNTNLSESFNIGSGNITVTFSGNTAELDQQGAVISPAVNQQNTGGLMPVENSLYVATDYTSNVNPQVTITLDFTGYPGGVGNLSFLVFDMDSGNGFVDNMTVTALTPGGPVNPTSVVTGTSNTQVNANTVRGTASSPGTSAAGNVQWIFGDAGTPVSGITRITIVYRNTIAQANPSFQWINIHDFDFDDPMADVSLVKSVAPASAEVGDTVTFTLDASNAGPDTAPGLQITDQLPAGFTYLGHSGGSYVPGTGVWSVGSVAASGSAQLTIDARVESVGPWDNIAEVTTLLATDPDSTPANNVPAEDDQDNAVVTVLLPEIGTAKAVTSGPTNNGDGTFTLTYQVTVQNSGDLALSGVQVVDDLAATFAGATGFNVDSVSSGDFTVNVGYNGGADTNLLTGGDTLAVATSGTVDLTVTVTPGANPGPYNNTATGSGTSPFGTGYNDDSTSGSNPDPDGDGNPGNNSTPTPVSFNEAPQIGVAKAVTAGPVNNGDGTHTLTYRVTIENFGDVVLNAVQAVDNLASTFSGATGFNVDSITSGDFTVNAGYNGGADTSLLAGTDSLAVAATGTVDFTVTVTPGGNLGPYNNALFAQGTSPGGSLSLDNSVDGPDPDPDGNGDPVDNLGPTPVSFAEAPEIGVAKAVTAGPTNNGDGTFTLTYRVTVQNSGDVALSSVQVVDNLATTFAGATSFNVDSASSGDFTVNVGYNGGADTNLLTGGDTLAVATSGTVDLTVTVTPGANPGPYNNTATGSGTSPGGTGVSDDSETGANPDPDGDGNPGNNSTPTPVSFAEAPQIGVAKAVTAGPVNNGDGTHTLTYRVTIENFGDVVLNAVQAVDNLASTFSGATGFNVDSITSGDFTVNAGYNGGADTSLLAGTDSLAVAATGTVDFTVTVTPGGNLGPYNNALFAQGTSPGGSLSLDNSVDGPDPDPDGNGDPVDNLGPTPVSFAEAPEIGVAKAVTAGPTNNGDGTFTLTYSVTVQNSGDVALSSVQVVDNLATTFAGATSFNVDSASSGDFTVNVGYNGGADTNLLTGGDSLAVATSGTVDLTVTVTPGANPGPYNNTATGSGTSPGGTGVSDDSETGANPDPDGDGNPGNNSTPTPVSFAEAPQIGVAKAVTAGPVNNGDGTHTLTYRVTIENFGDVVLNAVQAVDNLASTFSGATGFNVDSITSGDFTVNAGYNGGADTSLLAGTDSLAVAATGTVDFTVTVTPGGNLGPYNNALFAQGTSPGGSLSLDNSVDGPDPDPDGNGDPVDNLGPTPVSFAEAPEIGVAKAVTAGPTNNGDGTFTLTYSVTVQNSGDVALSSVQVVDNLATTFAGATSFNVDSASSGDFTVNVGYNGGADTNLLTGGDTLAVATSGTVDLTVTVTPGANPGPYNNTATGSGTSPGGTGVSDDSETGANPDPDGDGNPGNNSTPTPVSFAEAPQIGVAKAVTAGPVNNGDGTHTLTYRVTVQNSGDVALSSVQVVDNLATTFAGATSFNVDSASSGDFTVNVGYNGGADTNLLTGGDTLAVATSGTVDLTVTVTPGANPGPYNNTATGSGTSPGGTGVSDDSQSGVNPDPDGDGNPGNNSTPTPVSFNEAPQIGIAKALTAGPVNNGDGTHTLTYQFTIENFGDVVLNNVQAIDNLANTFSAATGFSVDSISSTDFSANGAFDGDTDRNLLTGADSLAIGATGRIDLTVTVTPGGNLGPYDNAVFAQGTSPGGSLSLDNSVDGPDPDPDGNGDPVDNVGPTPVSFAEAPEIGTAKAVTAGPTNNGDGTFTLSYQVTVQNSGDVTLNSLQVVDNLATTFAGATSFNVDSVSSGDFTVNVGYNGGADTNLLTGGDTLAVATSGTVDLTVTVTPGANPGPYNNTATGSGTSPGGTGVSDDSETGANPDPDGDGNPGNNSTPTPVSFAEAPQIGVAKAVTAGPVNNGDGTHTLTYRVTIENFGDVVLNAVQAVDNLASTFSGATGFNVDSITSGDFTVNAGYNGGADTSLLAGTDSLAVAATGTIDFTVTVTPGGNLGPYNNALFAQGTSPGGSLSLDNSVDGPDPDPDGNGDPVDNLGPTPVSFAEAPEIGVAKAVTAGPTNNGDGTFTLTYRVTVQNSGDVVLSNVQIVDNLATTFTGATGFAVNSVSSGDFTVNAGYNGGADTNLLTGGDTLAVATSGTVDLTVTVTPGANPGPYNNTATGSGTSPGGTGVSDDSQSGVNPDPDGDGNPGNNSTPTPVSFNEAPQIGIAKALTAGPVNNGDGTHTLTYQFTIENFGDVVLNNVQAIDNLANTFSAATGFSVDSISSTDFSANGAFDGDTDRNLLTGADSLAIGATGRIDLTVTVTPGGNLGPYDNAVFAQGTSPGGSLSLDNSVDGPDPDPDGNGDPVDNVGPTPVSFAEAPEIGTAKAVTAGPTNNGDGTFTLSYQVTVQNSGDVTLNSLQVVDNLATTFAGATSFNVDSVSSGDFTVNVGYNGGADTNLLTGGDTLAVATSGTVDLTVTVTPGANPGPYNNTATGSGTSPGGTGVSDDSETGANPDPDGDGNPGNNSTPTPVSFNEAPQIGLGKAVTAGPANNGDGTFTLTYQVTIQNSGDVTLNSLQVVDNLAITFAGATSFNVDSVTSGDFSVNAGYNGGADTNLLAGTDSLAAAASGTVDLTVTVTPGGSLGPYDNVATGSGTSAGGTVVTDDSQLGTDPDPDADGDPGNNNDPTPVSFTEAPQIGAAKAVSAGPTSNGNGTFTLTYAIVVVNSGDVALSAVQVSDVLITTFAGATDFTVDSVTSADFAVNAGYDGDTDSNLLAGTDTLAIAATGTVSLTVTVTPGGSLGPYDNAATATALSPAATGVSDISQAGANPDPDGDGNPGNNNDPTPVSFAEMPQLGAAKAVTTPINNGDGTFTLTYTIRIENSGDVVVNTLQVIDDLGSTFAGATGFSVDSVTSADFNVNAGYNGTTDTNLLAGTDSLAVAASGSVNLSVTVTPGGSVGPYDNLATATGLTPAGTPVSDVSTTGTDPDPGGDGPANDMTPTSVTLGLGVDATVDITDTSVPGDTLTITVTDADLNTDPGVAETIVVEVVNDTTGEIELVTLTETGPDTGIFVGTVDTVFGTVAGADNDGVFNTEIGHTVTVTYQDALTSTGGMATLTDTDLVGNTPPTAIDDSAATPIDTPVSIPVLTNDSDPNGHALLVDSVTQPANGAVTFNPDGTVIYTPDPGFTGTDTFTYTISDGNGGFDTATVTVVVDNDTPTAVADSGTTPVDTPIAIDVLVNDSDPNGDPLTIVPGSLTDPANGTAVIDDNGTPGDPSDDTVIYTPDPGFTGTDTFTYTITDPDGNTDTAIVTVVVSNDIPSAVDDADTTPINTPISVDVLANDSDPNDDPLSIDAVSQPANGTATIDDNGTPGDPSDDTVIYTPDPGFTGTDTFTYTISDSDGNTDIATVTITVQAASSITGNAWLDLNIDDQFDSGEPPLEGWIIELVQNGVVVATVPVAADGSYSLTDVPPGSGYTLRLRHPSSGVTFGVINDITLPPGTTIIDQNLAIDPSGVVYDSDSRVPVAGVTVTFVDAAGIALPDACLLPGQQNQVTAADGYYRFDVLLDTDPACPSGATYSLVFTTPPGYLQAVSTVIVPLAGPLDSSGLPTDPYQVATQPGAPQGGDSTDYYLSFVLFAGDADIINNHIPIDPVGALTELRVSKQADRSQTVVGDIVAYTITAKNDSATPLLDLVLRDVIPAGFTFVSGSARLNPSAGSTLSVNGQRPVDFAGIAIPAGESVTLRYALRVGAGVVRGDYTNTVTPLLAGLPVGNTASATVAVTADPDFAETTIIGTVFDDRDGDGWQDEDEHGIPGVRLATVEGLIIETDAYGRYHIAGVDGGLFERGRNFIIKVDDSTLPDGVEFTTENPRVQRITGGLMNSFNFGVRLPTQASCCEQIDVKIGEIFFREGSATVSPEFMPLVRDLADKLRAHGGGTLYIQGNAKPGEAQPANVEAYTMMPRFAIRSAQMTDADRRELDAIIEQWRGARNLLIDAVGHTDNIGIAPENRDEFANNEALSRARAQAVASYVRTALGVSPEQVSASGRGALEPIASNTTAAGRAQNRRVELRITGDWVADGASTNAGELARARAQRVYELLREMLGVDFMGNVTISVQPAPVSNTPHSNTQDHDQTETIGALPGLLQRSAVLLLGLLVNTAHANELPAACTVEACRTDNGYAIQILEPQPGRALSSSDTRFAADNDSRVDVGGRFMVPVEGGGRLWVTEDPGAAEPRMAVHAPAYAAAVNGQLAAPLSFYVYANYPAYIERAEIQIYHGENIDLIEPLAIIPFRPGVFSRVDWKGDQLSRAAAAGDELYFRVRAYDSDGRYDETHLSHVTLVTIEDYRRLSEEDPEKLLPISFELSKGSKTRGPLDGSVLALIPPVEDIRRERQVYELTPHFDTRRTELKPEDRAELDQIADEWRGGSDNVRIHVIGHADNVRIAPQHRNEFADNQALSEARARVVAEYLGDKLGLDRSHFVSEGRAAREPVASNATAAGRAQNRRVEVSITGIRIIRRVEKPARAALIEPLSDMEVSITGTLAEAINLMDARLTGGRDTEPVAGRYDESAAGQATAHTLAAVFGQNNLRVQRIPVNGSRVRVNGQDVAGNLGLRINGDPVPLDTAGRYAVEYVMPVGQHNFDVELIDERGVVTDRKSLPVEVTGRHIFLVALADLTISDSNISGSLEPLAADDRYDGDLLVEGRLAFYLKGKIKGKYLITAQLDSREEELKNLFSNLGKKDPQSVFRRLDPDRYYPVYGDDSTTISDTDTQGRFYVRADWDRSSATWGNFHTGFTGNEFAQYNRSLYGARYQHESLKVTGKGLAKTEATAFVSEAQTAFGHSEFLGTGGSLYYLRHQDILQGSEKAWIEVRDRDSERVRDIVTLVRGVDYEVDEIQGRLILSRPLMQISGLQSIGLIRDTPLDGNDMVLLVDYEYIPTGLSTDKLTVGGRGKHWVTDTLAFGATVVDENRQGEDYSLMGGDILYQPGEGTHVKVEYARSEASQADRFLSADGGLTFAAQGAVAPGREGDAWGVDARINTREALNTDREWVAAGWYRRTDDNYSVARRDTGVDTVEYGLEMTGRLSDRWNLTARTSVVDRENIDEDQRLSLQADYTLTVRSTVSGEVRNVTEKTPGTDAQGTLMALRYSYALSPNAEVYGIGQVTLANDSGRYDNNDLVTVGTSFAYGDQTTLKGEYSTGHRGQGALLALDHKLNYSHSIYGTFSQSTDDTDPLQPDTRLAYGHRSKISDQATLFNERQFIEDRGQAGIAHVFGLDYTPGPGWKMGLSVQQGNLETDLGTIDRDAATVTAEYRSEWLNWRGKAEFRDEQGVSEVNQLLTTNRLDLKLSENWRMLARLNHAETEDSSLVDRDDSALFTEAGIGFAYRPVNHGRLNLLAKYTFLYDLPAPFQVNGGTDQRSHVISAEGIYRISRLWEIGGKLAQRMGELRTDRDTGNWFESTTNFAALRGRYHLVRRWDAMLEYRRLEVDEADSTRSGWLVAFDRHINDHLRLGLGYNFTDFSDDLTNLDYDHKGWFVNAIGKY